MAAIVEYKRLHQEIVMRHALIFGVTFLLAGCEVIGLKEAEPDYVGEFSGGLNWTTSCNVTCSSTYAVAGRVELILEQEGSNVEGEGTIYVTMTPGPVSPQNCGSAPDRKWDGGSDITGNAASFRVHHEYTATGFMTVLTKTTFVGSITGETVTGIVTIETSGQQTTPSSPGACSSREGGTATFNVTLRKKS